MLWMLACPSHSDTCGLQDVHRAGVPKHVGRHPLLRDRRLFLSGGTNVLIKDVLKPSASHSSPTSVVEHFFGIADLPHLEPGIESRGGFLPQWQNTFSPPIAAAPRQTLK